MIHISYAICIAANGLWLNDMYFVIWCYYAVEIYTKTGHKEYGFRHSTKKRLYVKTIQGKIDSWVFTWTVDETKKELSKESSCAM